MTIARSIASAVAKPLAKPVASLGGGGTRALDIRASVGTSTSPTSTGTKAVTGVGFQPKVVLPFTHWTTASGGATEATIGLGAATQAAQATVAVSSRNGVTTTATHRRHAASLAATCVFNNAVYADMDVSAFEASGFTGNWVKYLSNTDAFILNHICLGGADLEVSLTQQQMNGTNAAQSFAHGLSGAPTGVLFFGISLATAPAITSANLFLTIGGWAGGNQFGAGVFSSNGVTTTATNRMLSTSVVIPLFNNASIFRSMAVSTVDATNVNCTYPVTTNASQYYFFMLAIRGAKCQVGTFDCNGSTSPLTINTTGIAPKLFLPVFIPQGADNLGTVLNGLIFGLGASDGTNNVSCGILDQNAQTTTNARRWQSSTTLAEHDTTGTKVFEATAAFSDQSIVITPTTNASTTWGQGAYFAIGN